ncbi:MAG: adenylate/guanylate cyclase domain-containing protein [Breznakibacter sp.]
MEPKIVGNMEYCTSQLKKILITLCLVSLFVLSTAQQVSYWKAGKMQPATAKDTIFFLPQETKLIHWDSTNLFPGPYSCRLQGFRNQWSEWTKDPFLILESIPHNNYLFEIKNNQGNYFSIPLAVNDPHNQYYLFIIAIFTAVFVLSYFIIRYFRSNQRKSSIEKNTPAQATESAVTQSFESSDSTKSHKYKKVTVLFADIQGFTKIVEHMNPEQLIDELDRFFIYFDEVVERFNIEKIKTIGDAYMCAGGLPEKNRTNPVDVVLAAMAMQTYVKSMQHSKGNNDFGFWELRIGIHTGSVISGMIGHKKRYFDIWGDSVNIASRMESSGIAGEINITGITYNMIKDFFVCEYRGKMPIKYKGETDMYFVKGIIPALSVNNQGKVPTRNFLLRLQHITFYDLLDYLDEQGLNPYIQERWFTDYMITAETLGRAERVTDEELLIIKTAGALIFPTLLNDEPQNELLQNIPSILKHFRYIEEQIIQIQQLTQHISKGSAPTSIEGGVISDAYYATLLRKNFLKHYFPSEKKGNASKLTPPPFQNLEKITEKLINHKPFTATYADLVEVKPSTQIQVIKHFLKKNP